jgi:predicted Zn finger-like uncharacterized protein
MKFACPSCQTRYSIGDERVAGRTVRIRCRRCGTLIRLGQGREIPGSAGSLPPGDLRLASSMPAELPSAAPADGAGATEAEQAIPGPPRLPSLGEAGGSERLAPSPPPAEPPTKGLAAAFRRVAAAPLVLSPSAVSTAFEEWFVGIDGAIAGPMELFDLKMHASRGAVTGESLVWREGLEGWRPLRSFAELLAVIGDRQLASMPPDSLPDGAADAQAAGGSLPAPRWSSPPDVAFSRIPGVDRHRGAVVAFGAALVLAVGLGFGIGYVAFGGRSPPEPIVKYVTSDPASEPALQADVPAPGLAVLGGANAAMPSAPSQAPGTPPTAPSRTPPERAAGTSPLPVVRDPTALVPDPAVAVPAGPPLDAAQVQRTVARYTSGVRRSCWQPALDARDVGAPGSAKVVVKLDVASNGTVRRATTSGDPPGYRGLARCIATRVAGWQFPASASSTTVEVPFVFAAQ